MIRLAPGCVCQPVLPPGSQTLLCTYTSDNPFDFCNDSQILPFCGRSWLKLKTSISPNRPTASVVPTNPEAGVARACPVPVYRAVTPTAALSNTTHVNFLRTLTSFFSLASPDGDARTLSDTLEGAVKRQCPELQALLYLPSNAVFCRRRQRTLQSVSGLETTATIQESAMGELSPGTPPSVRPPEDRLD